MPSQCAIPCCTKQPTYGKAGVTRTESCPKHADEGMVTIRSRKNRGHGSGCNKEPSFVWAGGKAER